MPLHRRTTLALTAALAALALTLTACDLDEVAADDPKPPASSTPSPSTTTDNGTGPGLSLAEALGRLDTADEQREGYDRRLFKHWSDADGDGCDARREVLLAEAVTAPQKGDKCALDGGEWLSYYDGATVSDAGKLDIDHMVPLAEAWDSGAHAWDADRREAFANDLEAEASLVAVTAGSNRSKGDKDPTDWLPPTQDAHCRYASEWIATKLRWNLTIDTTEQTALNTLTASCPDATLTYQPAP